jgi:hypothetical protein
VLPYENGKVWVFAFPLNKQNEAFAQDIIFVPSVYNIVLNSLPDQQISYTIGREQTHLLPRNISASLESTFEVENHDTGDRFIPGVNISEQGMRIDLGGSIQTAGHYLVENEGETLASLSFNYDRSESDLRYFSPAELEDRMEQHNLIKASVITDVSSNFSEVLREIQKGRQFWKWCLALALLFILAEVLIARFWKS